MTSISSLLTVCAAILNLSRLPALYLVVFLVIILVISALIVDVGKPSELLLLVAVRTA